MSGIVRPELTLEERAARKGIAVMLSGLLLFAGINALVKELASVFPVNQIVFFRGAFGLAPLAALLGATGVAPVFSIRNVLANVPHVIAMTGTLLLAYVAFAILPLSEVTAIFFLQPVLVAVLSSLVLREHVSGRLWIAVGAGFAGVLLIARPSGVSTDIGVAYGLGAAVLGSITMLQQRVLSRRFETLEIVFWFMALSSLAMVPSLLAFWVPPTPLQWAMLAFMGIVSGLGQFLLVLPLRFAPASRLAPVYYSNLLGGLTFGYLWFGESPDATMLVGCVVVVAATALALTAGPARPQPAPPPTAAVPSCESET
jgi:drug/metabolite transporter (DMT)-like permease